MFRLSKNRPAKSGDWVEFKFSNLKAIKVPKGWDKLFLTILSVKTGKTIANSSKAPVRNGSCEWTDTLIESIWSPMNKSLKEMGDVCLFKFVVAMGSARSGILGVTTVNMTGYMNSSAPVSVSLPLKKNNYGTVLQVTIHCMDHRMKFRDEESRESHIYVEDLKVDSHAIGFESEVFNNISPQSFTSSSSKDRSSTSNHGERETRPTSLFVSGSQDSYDSAGIFISREDLFLTCTNISSNGHSLRRDGNEELRAEAKMWERNARKLMLDLDMLRKEFSDQSKNQADLEMELSAMRAECYGLREEVDRLQKELGSEIKFQRESSADLAMQLKRSQESNMELVSLLQGLELENSVVQSEANKKMEENAELTTHLQQLKEVEKKLQVKVLMLEAKLSEPSDGGDDDLITEMEALKEKVQELERDCNELTDENLELLFKLKEINNKSTGVCTSCTNLNKKVLDEIDDVLVQELESSKMELESKVTELGAELESRRSEIAKLEANMMSKEEGIAELEAKVAELEKENIHLEANMKAVARESDITSKCFNDLQNDLVALSSSKSESGRLELEHFKSLAANLQDETTRLRNGLEIQKVELKQKLQDIEEECECLRRSNLELQATAEKLVDECTSLRRSNGELGEQNVVLNENCVKFEAKLVELLEENKKQEEKLIAEEALTGQMEAHLQEIESKLKHNENELNKIRMESDEIIEGLKAELSATKLEKEELEGSLHRILKECEEFKVENISLAEKISTLEMAVCELEDCKHYRVALESKLLEIECDHNQINITNGQLQRKIQQLKKDKDECVTKIHTLEDELRAVKAHSAAKINAKVRPAGEDIKFSKKEMMKSPNRHQDSRRKLSSKNDQAQERVRNRLKPINIQHHKEVSNGSWVHDQHPQSVDLDSFSKIQWLESELAKAVEANKTYKAQLNRSGCQIQHYGGEVVTKERFEHTKSSLESELKDIRERYLHMSLRYAEVEAQREELVMRLKAAKNDKRWFS